MIDKYRAAVANAEDLILVSDGFADATDVGAARILILNRRLLSALGVSTAEIEAWEGASVEAFLRRYAQDRDALATFWDRLRMERSVHALTLPFVLNDRRLCLEAWGRVLPNAGGGYYLLSGFRDITRMKDLEDRLLREQQDRAEWDAFLRHELRGKLGPIIGFAELLMINHALFPEDKVREFLSSIMESAHRLNGILDLSREVLAYERGEIVVSRKEQDVYNAVRGAALEAAVAVRRAMADHPALCQVVPHEGGLRFLHDSLKLQRALRDLLINAWEHTRDAATVLVEDGVDGVRIRVHNGGPPIPSDRLGAIFERFNSTKSGRMGLGTTVAWLLVEAQGGRIAAASAEGEGTTFTIWLPKGRGVA